MQWRTAATGRRSADIVHTNAISRFKTYPHLRLRRRIKRSVCGIPEKTTALTERVLARRYRTIATDRTWSPPKHLTFKGVLSLPEKQKIKIYLPQNKCQARRPYNQNTASMLKTHRLHLCREQARVG